MPKNKNAVVRYKFLDKLLSDKHHYYSMSEITDKVNDELAFMGYATVSKRALELDINFLEDAPFCAPITRFKHCGKSCIKYSRRNFSIFHKDITDEEEALIGEVLNTIGQFSGLPNFEWLDDLQSEFGAKKHEKVLVFNQNIKVRNSNLLASLFECVSNKQVLELHYKRFMESEEDVYEFHPYIIKQYGNRWYLVGWRPKDSCICTLPLDRIESFEPKLSTKLIAYDGDITKYFDDVIGVTVYADAKLDDIYIWVTDKELPYVETKQIHSSQRVIDKDSDIARKLAKKFPDTSSGGRYIYIRCKQNYELERELISHFGELVVLEPASLRDSIKTKIFDMRQKYL